MTGTSPFEAMTGVCPRLSVDLVPLLADTRISADVESFFHHMQQVHYEVRRHISASNAIYKQQADKHRRFIEFGERDMVMVCIRPERMPQGAYKKLHPQNTGPYKILKSISSNAYVLDLPSDFDVSSTFNVEDLTLCRGHDTDGDTEEQTIALPSNLPLVDEIVDVLDDQLVSTRQRGFQKFYVHWKNRPLSDTTRITATDFQSLNPNLNERYQAINSPESSSFKPERVDAARPKTRTHRS